jgi:hypothetical protein
MNSITRRVISSAVLVMVFIAAAAIPIAAQDTNLVRVNISVTESSRDRKVTGLEKKNFQIWEDNVAQEIVSMTPGKAAGEYVLAYKSSNSAKDGKWRDLRANVIDPKGIAGTISTLTVHFSAGYYAPPPGN